MMDCKDYNRFNILIRTDYTTHDQPHYQPEEQEKKVYIRESEQEPTLSVYKSTQHSVS